MLLICCLVSLVPLGAGWWAAGELAHPPRRPLQDYHQEFLSQPAAHGVVLRSFTCADGTPSLLCEPEPQGMLGKRGQLIREQLARKNIAPPPPGQVIGNLVLVHGRRGRKEDYLLIAERFCAAGFRCILPDLPAHGDNPATTACYGVKEAGVPGMVLREASLKFGFVPAPAGIMGISMGGAVSLRSVAGNQTPWRAAVFVATFDTLEHVINHQASGHAGHWLGGIWQAVTGWWFERETGMQVSAADSAVLVPSLKCPVLLAHGTADRVIPLECGRRLYEALPAGIEKRWVEIPDAGHDNVLVTDFPIYAEMTEWMLRHVPVPPSSAPR
ncbi:MAG: alpha/beta hydrolase [Prosthecobacter sp.]